MKKKAVRRKKKKDWRDRPREGAKALRTGASVMQEIGYFSIAEKMRDIADEWVAPKRP